MNKIVMSVRFVNAAGIEKHQQTTTHGKRAQIHTAKSQAGKAAFFWKGFKSCRVTVNGMPVLVISKAKGKTVNVSSETFEE